jgi:hypothetical protein
MVKKRVKKTRKVKNQNNFDKRAPWLGPRHKKLRDRYVLKGGAGWDGTMISRERIKFLYEDVPRREIPLSELPEILRNVTGFANTTDICPVDLTNQPEYVLKACKHPISSHGYGELARSQVPPPLQFGANLLFNCPMCRSPQTPGGPLGGVFCPAIEINPGLPTIYREPGKTRGSDKCEKLKLSEKGNTKSKYIATLPDTNLTFTLEIHEGPNGFEAHIILPKPRPKRGGKTRKRKKRKTKRR